MNRAMMACALGLTLLSGACYHATVDTGLQPGAEKVTQKWAMGFAWGLVPPETVNAASQCPNGVARVETQHSFLNSLVAVLTSGIVTPMEITVTCAARRADAGGEVMQLGAQQTLEQLMTAAVERSAATGEAVTVQFQE